MAADCGVCRPWPSASRARSHELLAAVFASSPAHDLTAFGERPDQNRQHPQRNGNETPAHPGFLQAIAETLLALENAL